MNRRTFVAGLLGGVAAIVADGIIGANPIGAREINLEPSAQEMIEKLTPTDVSSRRRRRRRRRYRWRRRSYWSRRGPEPDVYNPGNLPNSTSVSSAPPARSIRTRRSKLRFD